MWRTHVVHLRKRRVGELEAPPLTKSSNRDRRACGVPRLLRHLNSRRNETVVGASSWGSWDFSSIYHNDASELKDGDTMRTTTDR